MRKTLLLILLTLLSFHNVEATTEYKGKMYQAVSKYELAKIKVTLSKITSTVSNSEVKLATSRIKAILITKKHFDDSVREKYLVENYYKIIEYITKNKKNIKKTILLNISDLKKYLFSSINPIEKKAINISESKILSITGSTQTGTIQTGSIIQDVATNTGTSIPMKKEEVKIKEIIPKEKEVPTVVTPIIQNISGNTVSVCPTNCLYSAKNTSLNHVIQSIIETKTDSLPLKIVLAADTYYLDGGISIPLDNISIIGENKNRTIIVGKQGIDVIGWSGLNGYLENITIDASINNSLTAFSSGVGNIHIKDCIFKGGKNTFVIFFGGPSHTNGAIFTDSSSAYQLYTKGTLNAGIVIENSEVYSNFSGDTFVVALSDGAKITNNTIQGKLSYYMSKNGYIQNNSFNNTPSDALFISGPSENVLVSSNTFKDIGGSAIVVRNEGEHPLPSGTVSSNIYITQNSIQNTSYFGINLTNIYNSNLSFNKIKDTGAAGIYILGDNSNTKLNILSNIIENPRNLNDTNYSRVWGAGIGIENTDSIIINSNTIKDSRDQSRLLYGIYTHDNNSNSSINENTVINALIESYY